MPTPPLIPDSVILVAWRLAAEPERTTEAMVLAFARTVECLAHIQCAAFYGAQEQARQFGDGGNGGAT